jgi:prepilin-type N-terminal cleavage/methylation domain-containing protein
MIKKNHNQNKNVSAKGFTLVEIAIVLMIIGLLIGGILRGQELITSARVRNIIDQKSAIQTAYIGFIDRYRARPGDLTTAQATMIGNGVGGGTWGDGIVFIESDSAYALGHLAATGFISCGACRAITVPGGANINNSPVNVFGGVVRIGDALGASRGANARWYSPTGDAPRRVVITTGASIPSQILAEVDRKGDDASPSTGSFRFANFDGTDIIDACATPGVITPAIRTWANPTATNCEGAWLI